MGNNNGGCMSILIIAAGIFLGLAAFAFLG